MEYKEVAIENGITNWRRCPAMNTDQLFINDLADLVVESLSEPGVSLTESCVANNCEVEGQEFGKIKEEIGSHAGKGGKETEKTVDNILRLFGL